MQDKKVLSTVEEVRVFSDPYRLRILQQYYSLGVPATVKQVADRMKEVPANVHYHVKKMEKAGILALVYTKDINGITAKYYEPTAAYYDIAYKGIQESAKKLFLSETQKTISKIYEESMSTTFRELENRDTGRMDKLQFRISMETLYLTETQYEDVCEYMFELCQSNNKKEDDKKQYHFFSVIGEITG